MKYLLSSIGLLMLSVGFGQMTVIMGPGTDGTTVNTCSGGLFDSGGAGPATDYGLDENYTITICPDVPGDDINLLWTTFDLDCTDDIPGPPTDADRITIYDGDNIGAPTLGTYFCGDIAPFDVFGASMFNPTGCLTIVFTSNSTGTGGFSAEITCETPCDASTALAQIIDADNPEGDSIAVCVGEEVTFEDNGSFPGGSGMFTIEQWVWHWLDGTDNDTLYGPDPITHAFDEPGLYVVQLETIDDNGCSNTNTTDLEVFVSTYPTFDPFPTDQTICAGDELVLAAEPGEYPVTWDGFPVSVYIEDNCMPDYVGIAQFTPMTITGYDSGIELSDLVPDVLSICVDIEHTFIGDFVLQLQCPTGQIMTLHQQLGGGTNLGIPVAGTIDCDNPATYGVPWHYCFTADAAETWAVAAIGVGTVPEGDYLPIDPFSDLDGCPINGTWNMIFTDLWGGDDGSMPGWDITFADYLTPDITSFTPEIGLGADSSYWDLAAPGIISSSADADEITLSHDAGGVYEYTYYVVNSFGCEFDSTVTITAVQPADPYAGEDDTICHDLAVSYPLVGTVENPLSTHMWSTVVPPGVLTAFAPGAGMLSTGVILSEPGTYPLVLTASEPTGICPVQTDTVFITFSEELHTTDLIQPTCALNDGVITITGGGTAPSVLFSVDGGVTWSPDNIFDGLPPGDYVVQSMDGAGCLFESTVTLESPGVIDIEVSSDTLICENGTATLTAIASGGITYEYNWSYGGSDFVEPTGIIDVDFSDAPVIVSVFATDGVGCVSETKDIEITVRPPLTSTVTLEDKVCPGDASGASVVTVSGGDGAYTYAWTANGATIPGETTDEIFTNPVVETEYCVTISDGCETTPITVCTRTIMAEVLTPTFTSDLTWGCEPTEILFTNTTLPAAATANWLVEGVSSSSLTSFTHDFLTAGEYDVFLEVTSVDGCVSSMTANDYITIYAAPEPSFYATPNPTNIFNTTVGFINTTSGEANTYEWIIEGAVPSFSTEESGFEVVYPEGQADNYEVWLKATDVNGCFDSTSIVVQIVSDVIIFAPNVFTPDGDAFNESWRVYIDGIDIYDFHLTMFNRWGEMVWESYNPEGQWNGTYGDGRVVQDGTYVWKIEAKDGSTDKKYAFDGTVHVLK